MREPIGTVDAGRLVITRRYAAPIETVWACLTEPDHLGRWYGRWTGDPSSGRVMVQLTAEGDCPPEPVDIRRCEPPSALDVEMGGPEGAWRIELALADASGGTTLTLRQELTDPQIVGSVGPGWEYYLERLAAVVDGGDVDAVDFDAFYPALEPHYRRAAGLG